MSNKLIIQDEIHGVIELEGVYKELVQSSDFQRLKDIIQTGTSYFAYPEMEQESRFDHSVGSYYLMCKMIENIERKLAMQGIKVRSEEKEIAKIAILLHDIGHGAYSHTLENITGYSHERRGIDIVRDKNTNIHQIIAKYYGEEVTDKVGDFLERVYEHNKTQNIDIKIENGKVSLEELLASLISNNIDADRLDYITRDSKKAGLQILTEVSKLIESFEFILDTDKMIVAIPEAKKIYADMALLERARNYRDIYYVTPSIIGDHVFEFLLDELRQYPNEVPEDINPIIGTFLTNSKADFSTNEHMMITETPIREALETIKNQTQNEKLKRLCDMADIVKSYETINTNKNEGYIRHLLHKAIPAIPEDTKGIIEETRWIKPYKSNENENINIITSNGIEDYKDVEQDLISLKPFAKRVTAISLEMIRLELGISKEKFEERYQSTIEEVISIVTKPKDEFELRYVLTKGIIDGQEIKEKMEEKYEIMDCASYMSSDIYYDNPDSYELLANKQAFRIRRGTTFHEAKQTHQFKETRATYKKYKQDKQSNYTIRKKEEEIGETDRIEEYQEFLDTIGLKREEMTPVLEVNNLRYLYTIKINGTLMDISFNTANYQNRIYDRMGQVGTIEIRPRENRILDRLSMLELRDFLESKIPDLAQFLSNTNVYEIGILDTYEKYKKEDKDSKKNETRYLEGANRLEEISQNAKQTKDFNWLSQTNTENQIEER